LLSEKQTENENKERMRESPKKSNSWNEFQKLFKGKGYSNTELKTLYVQWKSGELSVEDHLKNLKRSQENDNDQQCKEKALEKNHWNDFQKLYKGKGFSNAQLQKIYCQWKNGEFSLEDHLVKLKKKEKEEEEKRSEEKAKNIKSAFCSVEENDLGLNKKLERYTVYKGQIRLKSEYLLGEDIAERFELSSAILIIENGKMTSSRAELLEKFPKESGVYLVLIRELGAKRWIPVYLGQAASGLRRRMSDYIHKDRFILDNESKKLKNSSFDLLSKESAISVQIRMFKVVSAQDAHVIERDILSEIN
jgi:hypothetical protein